MGTVYTSQQKVLHSKKFVIKAEETGATVQEERLEDTSLSSREKLNLLFSGGGKFIALHIKPVK